MDLQATNEDLQELVETLKNELIQSHEDGEHIHSELETLRLRAFDSQKSTTEEAMSRETALRDTQEDLERVRMEREEWEGEAMRERVRREEIVSRLSAAELELEGSRAEREQLREERDREAESAANLHAVLEEFQAGASLLLASHIAILIDTHSERSRTQNDAGRTARTTSNDNAFSRRLQAACDLGRSTSVTPLRLLPANRSD